MNSIFKDRNAISVEVKGVVCDSKHVPIYEMKLGVNGVESIVKVGEKNLDAEIQTYKDDVALDVLINKYQKTGDVSVLNTNNGIYGDISDMPSNPVDAKKFVDKNKKVFESIDKNLKKGRSYEDFINSLTPEELKKYVIKKAKAEATAKINKSSEVKENA